MALFGLIPFSISNDIFFVIIVLIVCYLVIEDLSNGDGKQSSSSSSTGSKHSHSNNNGRNVICTIEDALASGRRRRRGRKLLPYQAHVRLAPPIYSGSTSRRIMHMDLCSFARYIPLNVTMKHTVEGIITENNIKYSPMVRIDSSTTISSPEKGSGGDSGMSSSAIAAAGANTPTRSSISAAPAPTLSDFDICKKICFPFMPGCDPNGPEVAALLKRFPNQLTRPDCLRFLVARKGNLQAAEEMADKCLTWRKNSFPLKKSYVEPAFKTKCFFPYGVAKDGSPVLYMRGALYDCNVATPEQYVMAAAYSIDWALQQHPDQTNVTVIVHAGFVEGGPNQSADTNFIKLFIQVLSDNYPERLKRLAIFPFPWYGRAIWGVLKVFVDKRTQDKVMLVSSSSSGIPSELKTFMDPREMPEFCGGTSTRPIIDLLETLQ